MIDKSLLKERFKKNLKTYKDNSIIQNKMAEKLIGFIHSKPDDILELGCGTGVLTEKLIKKFGFKTYNAIDIVENCAEYIEAISPEINFVQSDIETYEFKQKYDLIISNATFQWVEDLPGFINKLLLQLKPKGILVFSTFGKENLKEISKTTGVGLHYYSVKELKNILNPDTIEEEVLTMEFKSPKAVLKHLKLTGVNSVTPKHWTKSDLIEFETVYKTLYPEINLTYNPIYLVITNNERTKTFL